jgi:autotransporter-associated beta strand protein
MPGQLITNNGLVQFNEPTTGTYAGAISGTGSVEKIGPGVTTLTGNHTFTGPTTVSTGALELTGSLQSPTTIQSGATLTNLGTINNTVSNSGTLNLNGTPTVTGAISGTGTVNVNGTFSQSNTIGAGQLNVTGGGTLTMTNSISAPTLIQDGGLINVMGSQNLVGNLTNAGSIDLISSGTNLNVNGVYAQGGGASAALYIDGVSPGSYSQIISTMPLDIAPGAILDGTLNPSLFLEPGVVIPAVFSGQGTPTQQGNIVLNIPSDRFNLQYRYNGGNVDLFLPTGITIDKNDFDRPGTNAGTYIGALARTTETTVQQLIQPTTRVLNNVYTVFNAFMEYDCDQFDKAGFCIWGGARVANMSGHTRGSGVLNIAYRLTESTRIGAAVDSRGSISSGPVDTSEPNPFLGLYAGYSQTGYSQKEINNGVQVFLSTGYYSGELSINRPLIRSPLLPQFIDSQPGLGHPSLTGYFVRSLVGYGFDFAPSARLMPYLGLRYTDVTRDAYIENSTEIVLQPIQFNPYFERLVTSFGGLTFDGSLNQKLGALLGIGLELDVSRSNPDFSGSAPLPIENFTSFNYVQSTSRNNFRPTAMAGLYYDPKTNHRISATGYLAQQPNVSKTYSNYVLRYELIF